MSFIVELVAAARGRGLPFLVIGGQAVAAWGVDRQTADFDLLVDRSQTEAWKECLGTLGYSLDHDGGNFLQFSSSRHPAWPVDLMLVQPTTFAKMRAAAVPRSLLAETLSVPALLHLVALKLHALKQDLPHRRIRDFLDVVELLQANHVDPREEGVRETFEQFGTHELYEEVQQAIP